MIRRNVLLAKKNLKHKNNKMKLELEENSEFYFGSYVLRNLRIINGNIYGDIEGPRKVVEVQAYCEFTERIVCSFSIYDDIYNSRIFPTLSYYYYKCRVSLNSERMEI